MMMEIVAYQILGMAKIKRLICIKKRTELVVFELLFGWNLYVMISHLLYFCSDNETASVRPLRKLYSGYCFTDPNDARTQTARQLRRQLGEFLHELATYFRTNRENDIESLKILLKVIGV